MLDQHAISYRSGPAWHVVYTSPQGEVEAVKALKAAGFEAYAPAERKVVVRRRRRVDVEVPLFSRYVFVAFDPHLDDWGSILTVDGVAALLKNGDIPSRVPTAWIDAIRKAEEYGVFDRRRAAPDGFKVGQVVRVTDGAFGGLNATIEGFVAKLKSTTASKRVKVLMDFLGRAVRMEMDVTEVERL
jgi:transcription antitermination factor NusG